MHYDFKFQNMNSSLFVFRIILNFQQHPVSMSFSSKKIDSILGRSFSLFHLFSLKEISVFLKHQFKTNMVLNDLFLKINSNNFQQKA